MSVNHLHPIASPASEAFMKQNFLTVISSLLLVGEIVLTKSEMLMLLM